MKKVESFTYTLSAQSCQYRCMKNRVKKLDRNRK